MKTDPTLTEIEDKEIRTSAEYWVDRVKEAGNHKSPFLDTPQERIDAFTARHRQWVEPWVAGRDVLEIGCGYGRTMEMFRNAKSYIGVDCVPSLIEEARKNFGVVFGESGEGGVFWADLKDGKELETFTFDICVAIAVISSVEPFFRKLKGKISRMLRPGGVILWLEEDYTRIDYK